MDECPGGLHTTQARVRDEGRWWVPGHAWGHARQPLVAMLSPCLIDESGDTHDFSQWETGVGDIRSYQSPTSTDITDDITDIQ